MLDTHDMSDEQLRERAKRYKVDAPRTASRQELEDMVQVAIRKHQLQLEEKARAERSLELERMRGVDPQTKAHPAPETLDILNSEKVYVVFRNLESGDEERADIEFNWGGTHTFHLWHDFIHVLPKCVIDKCNDLKNPIGKRPIYARRPHPSIPDCMADCVVGHRRRFNFEVLDGKPPKTATFGVVLDHKLYARMQVAYPEPIAQSA